MDSRYDYPQFSNIRSHIQRAEAQRHVEIGYALADALMDAGDFLRRAFSGAASIVRMAASRMAGRS
jgi:hypothetical protein